MRKMENHKRPEAIPGYVHPISTQYSRNGIYKTFTEGEEKKEEFGNTTGGKHYAYYADYDKKVDEN